ncbi:MAG TPA: glycosyltransferase family 4 protein [Aggregicoccus sp.]|nr:glycosyltransferase family 4 protein [Aggregicoccus sp.]
MRRLKVAHLTSVHHAFDVRIFRKQCTALSRAGNEVVLVAAHPQGGRYDGVTLHALRQPRGRLERMTRTAFHLFRAALRQRADLYHVHDPELLPWAQLLRMMGRRVVFDMHENVPLALLTKAWIPAPLRRPLHLGYRAVERLLLSGLPVVFAEDSYGKHYPWVRRHVCVLNMPLASELTGIQEQKHARPTVGYLGSVTAQRGSAQTLEALGLLRARGLDVHFDCLGPAEASHEARLRARAAQLGLSVHLPGRVPCAEGWRQMARCHVGLAVLQAIPNYVESYPTKLFEYMALGLPVVATGAPLYRSVVERFDCGRCVDPERPEQLADALEWLLGHPEEAAAMGARGRRAVLEHFSWEREFAKLHAFYAQLHPQPAGVA